MIPQVRVIDLKPFPAADQKTALNEILHQLIAGKGKGPYVVGYDQIPLLVQQGNIRLVRVAHDNYELHYYVAPRGR